MLAIQVSGPEFTPWHPHKNGYSSVQLGPQHWDGRTAGTGGLLESPKQPINELQVSRRRRGDGRMAQHAKVHLAKPDNQSSFLAIDGVFSCHHKLYSQDK